MRFPNWPDLLAGFIEARRSRPFEWGANDCCLFAADWITLATGKDPASELRGKYSTALEAHRYIAAAGGLVALVEEALTRNGFSKIDASLVGRGDLIIRDGGDGDCVGISIGSHAAFVGTDGLRFVPIIDQVDACFWKI
jgi:hypothetical protein